MGRGGVPASRCVGAEAPAAPGPRLTRGESLRVAAVAVGVALLAWIVLFFYGLAMLGQGLGSLFEAMAGTTSPQPWWATDLGGLVVVGGTLAVQIVLTWALARRLGPPERRARFGRLGLGLALVLGALPVGMVAVLEHRAEEEQGRREQDRADRVLQHSMEDEP